MRATRKRRSVSGRPPRYALSRDRDGVDDLFLIWDTASERVIDQVAFWDDDPEWEARAEAEALRIVRELNLLGPRHVRAFDDVA